MSSKQNFTGITTELMRSMCRGVAFGQDAVLATSGLADIQVTFHAWTPIFLSHMVLLQKNDRLKRNGGQMTPDPMSSLLPDIRSRNQL